MPDFEEPELDRDDLTRPISAEERTGGERPPWFGIALALVLLASVAILFVRWQSARVAPPAPAAGAPAAEPAAPATEPAPTARAPLPALGASDAFVRELALAVSRHPRFASWLANDELVRRFVAAVINVADGSSPNPHLRFLTPADSFRARRSAGAWSVDPESFGRYDLAADVFASLDTAHVARLFAYLHPLFDLAYAEIGDPTSSFDATLARAIERLLAVPVPELPLALIPEGAGFAFADHGLEERPLAEKQLLRMGPANQRRVQEKLRELAAALGTRAG